MTRGYFISLISLCLIKFRHRLNLTRGLEFRQNSETLPESLTNFIILFNMIASQASSDEDSRLRTVHPSKWTTDQNLVSDRPTHGQNWTLDQDYHFGRWTNGPMFHHGPSNSWTNSDDRQFLSISNKCHHLTKSSFKCFLGHFILPLRIKRWTKTDRRRHGGFRQRTFKNIKMWRQTVRQMEQCPFLDPWFSRKV